MVHDGDQPRPDVRHLLYAPPDLSTPSRRVRLPGEPLVVAVVVMGVVALCTWVGAVRPTVSEVDTTPTVITVDNVVESEYAPGGHGMGQTVVRIASGHNR